VTLAGIESFEYDNPSGLKRTPGSLAEVLSGDESFKLTTTPRGAPAVSVHGDTESTVYPMPART
jgi:hypothetical protein